MAIKKPGGQPFAIGMKKDFIEAPPFRPALNVGCLMDIPTGRYIQGNDGHWYHTGGLSHVTGIGGRGNTYKSVLAHWMAMMSLDRYWPAEVQSRDTEFSQSCQRFQDLSQHMPRLSQMDLSNIDNFVITSQGEESGNVWFKRLSNYLAEKRAAIKEATFTSPFIDPQSKKPLRLLYPSIIEIDSLSAFTTDVVEAIFEKNEVGDGAANTVHMRASGAKSQMIMQLPGMAAQSGGYVIFTAHMGDDIQIDAYAPPPKKLAFLKNKLKFKSVPENITFLTNNLWVVLNVAVEHTKEHTVTYPKHSGDNQEGDTDLQRLSIQNLRGKAGPSGLPFDLILSQREGVLVPLSEYHYLKSHGRFGIGGDNTNFYLELYPDVKLGRTTLRGLVYSDPLLARAMTITTELCQIKSMLPEYTELTVSPKQLYKNLVEKGYDWNKLLDTRGFWVFKENEADNKPFLSTLDLLHLNAGHDDHPWCAAFKVAA